MTLVKRVLACIMIVCSSLGSLWSAAAQAEVTELSYLLDHHQQLSTAEVLAGHYDDAFTVALEPQQLNIHPTQALIWLRVKLTPMAVAEGDYASLALRKNLLAEVEAYAPYQPGDTLYTPLILQEGPLVNSPQVAGRYPVFRLPQHLAADDYLYLRIWAPALTLDIPLVVQPYLQHQRQYRQQLSLSTSLYGVLAAMLLIGLSMSVGSQRRYYIPYSLLLLGSLGALVCISGDITSVLPMTVFPYGIWLLYASLALSSLGTWWLARIFLQTKTAAPRMHLLLNALLVPPLMSLLIFAAGFYSLLNYPPLASALFGTPLVVVTAIYCWCKGYKPARFFILAWSCALLGQLAFTFGKQWPAEYSDWVEYAIFIGVALEAILLSLAINDRHYVLDKEHQSLREVSQHYQALSMRDPLTDLFNKRYFLEWLEEEHQQQRNHQESPLSVIMLDIDHFKAFNDRYGHPEGDKVIKALGATIADNLRQNDVACRYGGEEFAIILPDVHSQRAELVAERIRKAFAKLSFTPSSIDTVGLTVSQGVATAKANELPDKLIKRADQALYVAKKQNRNQVVVSEKVLSSRSDQQASISE